MNALGTDKNAIVGKRYMDLETDIGVMTEISYNDAKSEYIYTVDGADYSTASDYSDLFGMNVQVLYKVDGRQTVVYGISEYDSDVMVEGVLGDIDDFDKIDGKDEITVSDVDYKVDRNAVIYDFNNDATARTGCRGSSGHWLQGVRVQGQSTTTMITTSMLSLFTRLSLRRLTLLTTLASA